MRRPALTQRRLKAMAAALAAMLAGPEGDGDWPEDVTRDDMEAALAAVQARMNAQSDNDGGGSDA